MKQITTKEAFREWLSSLRQDEPRFWGRAPRGCPLSQYAECSVGYSEYGPLDERARLRLPHWASVFAVRFDRFTDHSYPAVKYTPAAALSVLDEFAPQRPETGHPMLCGCAECM